MTRKPDPQLVQLDASNHPAGSLTPLFGLDQAQLSSLLVAAGEPAWRGKQLAQALYRQRVEQLSEISTLPKALRDKLTQQGLQVARPAIAQTFQSIDGTERYLIQCHGSGTVPGETVETVWMPEGDNGDSGDTSDLGASTLTQPQIEGGPCLASETWDSTNPSPATLTQPQVAGAPSMPGHLPAWVGGPYPQPSRTHTPTQTPTQTPTPTEPQRATICVSSQIGCAVNCQFCLTAKLGLQRNLTPGEIAGQVVTVLARHNVEVGRDRLNLVFMGMGEPFLNYDNFMAAVRLLVTEVGLSPQRMTVSTSGIVPGIERFAQEPPEFRPKLAISLNAPNNQVRQELMPINRKWNIEAVVDAVRQVRLRPRERITFEYVLLAGVTDQPQHAQQVARLVRRSGLPAKVNLIAWNPGPGIPYKMPTPDAVALFRTTLIAAGIPTFLRKPRGRDIYAACGQLKRTVEG